MKSKIEDCLYMQVAHCSECGGQSGYNIYDGEKICFDCGEPYEADFHISEVESTITTTNSQDQEEEDFWKTVKKGEEIYNDFTGEKSNMKIPKDTPEEWEKKFDEEFEEIGGVIDSNEEFQMVAFMSDNIKEFIKQLLEEKEKEAKKELLEQLVIVVKNGTPEEFQRVLDNLSSKKK